MNDKQIIEYYGSCVEVEWNRLIKDPSHRLEFDTTMHFVSSCFPERGVILDAGGGPGRYSLELARRGYDVVLLDPVAENLEFARQRIAEDGLENRFVDICMGSICDLSMFEASRFDAVVCLGGPLSHVLKKADRILALRELARVARIGAPVLVSVIGRLAVVVTELVRAPHEIEMSHFRDICNTGDYDGAHGFTASHFFLPEELQQDIERSGSLTLMEMAGLEGLGTEHAGAINELAENPSRWNIWYETHLSMCTHPAVVGTSQHFLAVCRRNLEAG